VSYGLLERMSDNPMITLNRAVAVAMGHGPCEGLELLATLADDPRLRDHYRLAAVRAHMQEWRVTPSRQSRTTSQPLAAPRVFPSAIT
jgi:predicted RNA polymerase sigma factor